MPKINVHESDTDCFALGICFLERRPKLSRFSMHTPVSSPYPLWVKGFGQWNFNSVICFDINF